MSMTIETLTAAAERVALGKAVAALTKTAALGTSANAVFLVALADPRTDPIIGALAGVVGETATALLLSGGVWVATSFLAFRRRYVRRLYRALAGR